jgi:hypothetical protein
MLATKELNYKELQTKLHELRDTGADVQVKLNSKHDVLLAEYQRLTAVEEVYTVDELPALNKERVPSWLAKPHAVYWIDCGYGYEVDFLPWELELWLVQHEGACCQLEVMEELETLTLQALEADNASFTQSKTVVADTVENRSMDEQEEETLRVSVAEPQFFNTGKTEGEGGGALMEVAAKDLDNVPALYIAIALPIWFMVCIAMPRVSSTFKALLRVVEKHISKLGVTEQRAWFHLKYSFVAAKWFLLG